MRRVALKNRALVLAGQAPPGATVRELGDGEVGDGFLFIQGNAEFGIEHPSPHLVATHPPKVAPKGAVLLSVRAPVGALNIADRPLGIGRGIAAIVPTRQLDPRFLWWGMHSLRDELASRQVGSTYGAIDARSISTLPIPDLSIQAQRQVAMFLDRECERIGNLGLTLSLQANALDEFRAAIVRDAVRNHRVGPLKRGFFVVDCKHRTPNYLLSGYPAISTREVKRGALDLRGVDRFVGEADFHDMRGGGRDPKVGDIIYSRNATVGVAAYVSEPVEVCMGQDVVLITRRPRQCELLAYVLNFAVTDQVERASQGSTFGRINVPVIRSLVVPHDSPEAETEALRLIRSRFGKLTVVEGEMRTMAAQLAEYRDSLIADAVTGKLDITRQSDRQLDESAHAAMEGQKPEVLSR